MLLSIITLPLFCAILAGFFGRHVGRNGASIITIAGILINFIVTIILIIIFFDSPTVYNIKLGIWIPSELFQITWTCNLDSVVLTMCFVVNFISGLVHIYSSEYMKEDPHLPRFMSYLSLFTFFMLILITGDNFIQLFLGWEGVGLCSFLLISFWTTRVSAVRAAIKALIINRIADVALILGILTAFCSMRAVEFPVIFALTPYYINQNILMNNIEISILVFITMFLTIGAMGKSAQIFLHTWLPDAMEGPTPVSALIHAATMVTAGVFLIIKCSPIFEYTETTLVVLVLVGGLTALFSSTIGIAQYDIKKVIAYSTCSQLGYMVFICGISAYNVSLFHLMNHAVFKALLFLSAGAIIHSLSNEQDMRRMGGLTQLLPFVYATTTIGSLALMGFPFLTGYYSKDLILELAYSNYTLHSSFVHWLGTLTAFFTSVYSLRLIYLTFIRETRLNKGVAVIVHESTWKITLPLTLLSIGSISLGYVTKDLFVGVGSPLLDHVMVILPNKNNIIEAEFLPFYIKNLPFLWSIFSILSLIGVYKILFDYNIYYSTLAPIAKIHRFLNAKWYFDAIYNKYITKSVFYFSYNKPIVLFDKGLLEIIGPLGVATTLRQYSIKTRNLQVGLVYYYASYMLFLALILLLIF